MIHRDVWSSPLSSIPRILYRVDEPPRLAYFAAREWYDDGYDNGYAYTTPEHDDGTCEEYHPRLVEERL